MPTNRKRLAFRKLVTFDGKHHRIDHAGFDTKTNMVTSCAYCEKTLGYSRSTKKLQQSWEFYDPGTIPTKLQELSLIEFLAIFKNLVYTSVFYVGPITGEVSQIGLKGYNSYVFPIDTVKSATTLATSLPREDLRRHEMVGFMGTW